MTLKVKAGYTVTSPRRIALRFKSAGVSDVNISDFTETLIAPALLGRSWLSHRILLALKEVCCILTGLGCGLTVASLFLDCCVYTCVRIAKKATN